jgi:hypothetical protein
MYKVQFEVVSVGELSKAQQKINTWLTTGHLKKFETHVLSDRNILFQYLVLK